MKIIDIISGIIIEYISPYLMSNFNFIFLILLFIAACLIYNKTDSKKMKYAVLLLSIIFTFIIHTRYENEKKQFYTHMYFDEIKARIFNDGLEIFNTSNEKDMASGNELMMDINYLLTKTPVPYYVLKYTVNKYYKENNSKIPQHQLQELTEFVSDKIEKNKSLLIETESKKYLQQCFFDTVSMIMDFFKKIDNGNFDTKDDLFNAYRIFNVSLLGYFDINNDYILSDYKKTISFLDTVEEDFTNTKNSLLP